MVERPVWCTGWSTKKGPYLSMSPLLWRLNLSGMLRYMKLKGLINAFSVWLLMEKEWSSWYGIQQDKKIMTGLYFNKKNLASSKQGQFVWIKQPLLLNWHWWLVCVFKEELWQNFCCYHLLTDIHGVSKKVENGNVEDAHWAPLS